MTVIFDLDGTLSDSALLTQAAFAKVAPENNLPPPSLEAIRRCTGIANPEFYDHLYPGYPREQVRRAGLQVEEEELRLLPGLKQDLLFPGCRELLQELRRRQIPLYIASTGGEEHVEAILAKTGIGPFFEAVLCGRPDKAGMIGEILAGRDPAAFRMVGDMSKDCEGAHANGVAAVGACYGYCVRGRYPFDHYIDRPLELLDLL